MKKVIILTVIFLCPTLLFSQERVLKKEHRSKVMKEKMMHKKKMFKKAAMKLPNLTEEQKEKIKGIKMQLKKELFENKKKLIEVEADLQVARLEKNASMSKIYSLVEKIGEVKIDNSKLKEKSKQDIRKLLTDEQRLVFDERSLYKKNKRKKRIKKW